MKKKTMFIIGLFVMFFCYINVYAADACESSELSRLRKLAEKVDFDYSYEIKELTTPGGTVNKYIEYSISAINLNDDLQVVIMEDYFANKFTEFKGDSEGKATLKPFLEGDKVNITIYAYTENACSGKKITTKTITLPYYNKFYDLDDCRLVRDYDYCMVKYYKEYCDDFQTFKYCQKFIDESVSQEKFDDKLNDFRKGKYPRYFYVGDLQTDNKWIYFVVGGGIVLIVAIFVFVNIKHKKVKRIKINK